MSMSEDIIIVMVVSLFLFFCVEYQLFLVLAFVWAWVRQFFYTAFPCPLVSEGISPCGWHESEESLGYGVMEEGT